MIEKKGGWKRNSRYHSITSVSHSPYAERMYGVTVRQRKCQDEIARLQKLQYDLQKLGRMPFSSPNEIIKFAVRFLNLVSFCQDAGYIQYQGPDKKESVDKFNLLLEKCGRETGWNTSRVGENVTLDNVIFGGPSMFNLPLRSARLWLSCNKGEKILLKYHNPIVIPHEVRQSLSPAEKHDFLMNALNNADTKEVIKTEELWVTEALVFKGQFPIFKIIKNNFDLACELIEQILV